MMPHLEGGTKKRGIKWKKAKRLRKRMTQH